jgi:NAD(P)-dependent dehydrogenase (short-subunit alcohol dehydrogenase family)
MPLDLKGKVVMVTGAATGMGQATALEFASLGSKVAVVTGSNVSGGQETVRLIREAGVEAEFFRCNVTNEAEVEAAVAAIVQRFGRLDCAFNNAGVGPDGVRIPYGPLTELTEALWDKVMNVNLKGMFFCLKHELRQMQKQGGGAIVNNASIGGLKMAPGFGAYGPSKAGVIAITRTAAMENAKSHIRVNVVCPGPTEDTDLMRNTLSDNPEEATLLKEHVIPMGKLGTAADVARAVVFLASDQAAYITGQVLTVDGGMVMH